MLPQTPIYGKVTKCKESQNNDNNAFLPSLKVVYLIDYKKEKIMTGMICGFRVNDPSKYKFVPEQKMVIPNPGEQSFTKMIPDHYESWHLDCNRVEIYPGVEGGAPATKIIKDRAGHLTKFTITEDKILKHMEHRSQGVYELKRTPAEVLKKAQEFFKNAPAEIKNIVNIEKFKWIKVLTSKV